MKTGVQIGVAVAAGYVLGRFHKLKWAVALGTMAGRKKLAGQQSALLAKGAELLGSELGPVTQQLRGQLVEAGKAAAVTAVSGKINSLSDSLQERSQGLRAAGSKAGGAGSGESDETGEPDDLEDRDETDARDEADAAGEPDDGEPDRDEVPAVPEQRTRPRGRDRDRDSRRAHDAGKEQDTGQERRGRAAERRPAASRAER